jgi:hypothetical protein
MGTYSPKGTLNESSDGNSKIPMLRSICYEHIYYYKSQISYDITCIHILSKW